MNRVLLGAVDWQHPNWNKAYYPEDLPSDWRLSYYANQFQTVLIDLGLYTDTDAREQLLESLEECHTDFSPVIKIDLEKLSFDDVRVWLNDLIEIDIRPAGILLAGETRDIAFAEWSSALGGYPLACEDSACITAINSQLQIEVSPAFPAEREIDRPTWIVMLDCGKTDRELAADLRQALQNQKADVPLVCLISSGYEEIECLFKLESLLGLFGV